MNLTTRARYAHPLNRRNAAKYVLAVRYLRRKNLWVLDLYSKRPGWSIPQ